MKEVGSRNPMDRNSIEKSRLEVCKSSGELKLLREGGGRIQSRSREGLQFNGVNSFRQKREE